MEALKELTLQGCHGLTDAGMAVLATVNLDCLSLRGNNGWSEASLQFFGVSNISQTLESLDLYVYEHTTPIDDVQVATALASCHNLKKLTIHSFDDGCVFGRSGLDGLQAMATGCPLLTDVELHLTVPGLHYLATHCSNLKYCAVYYNLVAGGAPPPPLAHFRTPEGFPSIEELQTLYPAVKWRYFGS
jgi:hypothetical protein